MPKHRDLAFAAVALLVLPFALNALGLGVTSATEVVIFAIACMALNILVGYSGLLSFGHGAWFGLGAYAAAVAQREHFKDAFVLPMLSGVGVVLVVSAVFGFLILRRRGVYFSLLTLALSAMLYAVAFRWTELTGGENGLGGIARPHFAGYSLENTMGYYAMVAVIGFAIVVLLWRFHRSPLGRVLVGIRENDQRRRWRRQPVTDAAMAAREAGDAALPESLRPAAHGDGPILVAEGLEKSFGGIRAVQGASLRVRDRTLHALIGPNGAGKTTAFNLI